LKTILVTGASSGIGRALAVRAARAGYSVYAVGRNMKALGALGSQVSEEGGVIRTDATDVSVPGNAPGLIGRMLGAFGQIDVLVNNAGAVAVGPIATQTDEDLQAQFGTHVIGPLAIVREALPSLRATRGHVFMLGSGVARVPVGGLGAYPPSKAALRSATTILRRELTPLEIAVTYVDPGAVDTVFMSRAGMPGAPASMLVSPELVARKILFAIATRPRVLNVAPLQTAAVAVAELLPALTEAVLERNPSLIGSGPSLALTLGDGRTEKMALPASMPLAATPEAIATAPEAITAEPLDDEQDLADEVDDDIADDVADDVDFPDEEPDAFAEALGPMETAPEARLPEPEMTEPTEPTEPEEPSEPEEPIEPEEPAASIPTATVVAAPTDAPPVARWTYEPPEADDAVLVDPVPVDPVPVDPVLVDVAADAPRPEPEEPEEPAPANDDETARATSSFDAALEPLRNRMLRSNFSPAFVRGLLVPDAVLDVGETAMRWAGMPNKHERALTGEVFFALAEWGFLAPRADGRYRVIASADMLAG
jgi:short-subunit dehydrogenase